MIQSVYKWHTSTIEHVCDSESALDRIWNKEKDGIFDQSRPDADAMTVKRLLLSNTKHTIISPLWVRGHTDKRGPPYTLQEKINMQTDNLAGKAHINLPLKFKAQHDFLHFPEHHILHISLVLNEKKVTFKITRHVSRSIQYPSLKKYLIEKEEWNECTWNEIGWPSFKIAFNKIPSARQPTITKMIFSFWCSNIRHFRDRSQRKLCCLCGREADDWNHILSCPGPGATIKRNESWDSLKSSQAHFDIPTEFWLAIEHGIKYFNTFQ
jgi:hypothetical protein